MAGRYEPYDEKDMIKLVAEAKSKIPKWVRIMRVQREISAAEIVAGPKYGNFRQTVLQHMSKNGMRCVCIRCREAGLSGKDSIDSDLNLYRKDLDSSNGARCFYFSFTCGRFALYLSSLSFSLWPAFRFTIFLFGAVFLFVFFTVFLFAVVFLFELVFFLATFFFFPVPALLLGDNSDLRFFKVTMSTLSLVSSELMIPELEPL